MQQTPYTITNSDILFVLETIRDLTVVAGAFTVALFGMLFMMWNELRKIRKLLRTQSRNT